MTFGQPLLLWLLVLLPVLLALFMQNERRRGKLLRQLVAARLQDRLAGTVSIGRRRFRFFLLLLALACIIVSLAQPRLGYTWEQSRRKGRDVLIAIDCSRSMLATDLAPNRLGRAKLAAQDFIGQLEGDRVGLIAFAGSSFLQAPLTVDYGAVLNSLAELDVNVIPRGGTDIAGAIKEAVEAFGKGESENRALVIFTDGEELDADGVAVAEQQKGNIKIFTVGLGSLDGSLIPLPGPNGGTAFVKDESGQIVKSKLDEDRLRKIAEVTGGFYVHLESGPAEMKQIVHTGLGQMKEQEIDARMSRRPIERYQWPLAAGLVLLVGSTLVSERRRPLRRKAGLAVVASLILSCGTLPPAVQAKNSGVEAYERQDYKESMDEFSRQLERMRTSEALQFNLGAAAYKSGDYAKALDAFAKALTSSDPQLRTQAEYNLGNTLYQRGAAAPEKEAKVREWKDAIQHYEQALKVTPGHKDAEYNRDVVRKLLEDMNQPPPEQKPPPEKKDEQKKDDQKKDDQKKDQDQNQPKQGEQKDKDQQQKSSQKDQPSKGSQGQQSQNKPEEGQGQDQDQQKKDQQGQDQPGKNQEKDPSQNQPGQQDKPGKGDEKKDAANDPGANGQNPPQSKDGGKSDPAGPPPGQPDRNLAGDIKAQGNPPTDQPPPNDPQQEAAAEAQAAQEGKMTEAQARTLLESLKGEDERVQLLKRGERRLGRPFRDW